MSRKNVPPPPSADEEDDNPGMITKVLSGRTDKLDAQDIAEAGATGLGFIPGPLFQTASSGFQFVGDSFAKDKKKEAIRKAGIDLDRTYGAAAKRTMKALEESPYNNLWKGIVMALAGVPGGIVGTMLGTMVLPFGGTLIGGFGGFMAASYLAGQLYEGFIEKQEQDCVTLATRSYKKLRKHETISEEEAFATLMANLPEFAQKRYEDMLAKLAGTRDFAAATQTEQGRAGLDALMQQCDELDDLLRSQVYMPLDRAYLDKKIWQQYAELVNGKYLDARAIILDPTSIEAAANRYYMQQAVHGNSMAYEGSITQPQQQLPPAGRIGGKPHLSRST